MRGRTATSEEKRHMSRVSQLGCIVCRIFEESDSPAMIHHVDGSTKPGAHFKVLPLCYPHHQGASPTGEWATRHSPGRRAGKVEFEKAYGTEQELLAKVGGLIDDRV